MSLHTLPAEAPSAAFGNADLTQSLSALLPELFLSRAAMALLLVGVFWRGDRAREIGLAAAACLALAALWGHQSGLGLWPALWLTAVLAVLEVSLSFDNAVVNASVLKTMDAFWQKMFLTVGILIAVFGMRLVFPILIVAVMAGMGAGEVVTLALERPDEYGRVLEEAYPMIAFFGGAFLLMVFLNFALDETRQTHWLGSFEARLARLGKLESAEAMAALAVVACASLSMPEALRFDVLLSGVCGVMLFVVIHALDGLFGPTDADGHVSQGAAESAARHGFMGFMYLEVLDASFSFDGVIGAFAITRDVVIIMLGLAIGAMFVRSMTVDLVRRDTLGRFIYLEHGAMYAIGALALIMFAGTQFHVPEVITGLIGALLIGTSLWSSVRYRRAEEIRARAAGTA